MLCVIVIDKCSDFKSKFVIFSKEGQLLHNYSAGHILRTKAKNVNEGGIMAGAAVLDSPLLV